VRALTQRPFGVNLLLHSALRPPADPAAVPADVLEAVRGAMNRIRRTLGIPETNDRPPRAPDFIDAQIEVILEEKVPLFGIGLGMPAAGLVSRFHERGAKVMVMVTTVADAIDAAAAGADVIAAQGAEAGGHRSTSAKRPPDRALIGTMTLVPQVVDAVRVPVVAAGGITTGRQLAAALVLGAQGVLIGTRFIATTESAAPPFHKQAIVDRDSDSTTLSDAFTGAWARVLRNPLAEEWAGRHLPTLPAVMHQRAALDVMAASATCGRGDYYPMYAGQGVGMIHDVPTAAEVVSAIVDDARKTLAAVEHLPPERAGGSAAP
jgi:nitronate monooxygenase